MASQESTVPVLTLGESVLDVFESRTGERTKHVGGSPLNVAAGLGELGYDSTLGSWIGSDPHGRMILDALNAHHVKLLPGTDGAPATTYSLARLDRRGAANYIFTLEWNMPPIADSALTGHIHAGSFSVTEAPGGPRIMDALRRGHGAATISYDPNVRPLIMGPASRAVPLVEEAVGRADVVRAANEDFEWLYPSRSVEQSLHAWLALGPSLIVVTFNDETGVAVTRTHPDPFDVPTVRVDVADHVGAQDSYTAGLLSGLLDDGLLGGEDARARLRQATPEDLQSALARGAAAMSITLLHEGSYQPSPDQVNAILQTHMPSARLVSPLD